MVTLSKMVAITTLCLVYFFYSQVLESFLLPFPDRVSSSDRVSSLDTDLLLQTPTSIYRQTFVFRHILSASSDRYHQLLQTSSSFFQYGRIDCTDLVSDISSNYASHIQTIDGFASRELKMQSTDISIR